jgi:tetratricopeptide (TPR) repeat protein
VQFSPILTLIVTLSVVIAPQISFAQTVEQLIEQASSAQANARYSEAEALWRRVIKMSGGNNIEAYKKLGEVLFYEQKIDAAIAIYKQAIKIKPSAEIYAEFGDKLRTVDKLQEAIAAYREAIKLDPKSDSAHFGIAQALDRQGKKSEAIAAFEEAVELNPNTDNYESLGDALKKSDQKSEAIAAYRQAIKIGPKNYSAYLSLGEILPLNEAVATFRKLTKKDPTNDVPLQALGYLLNGSGKFKEAVSVYRQAIKINPSASNYAQLGDNLLQQKKFDSAIAAFEEAVKKEPSDYIYSNLASALVKQDKLDEALAGCRQVIQLKKGIYETCVIVGMAIYEKQGFPAVKSAFNQFSADIKPKHMAEIYIRLGREIQIRRGTKEDGRSAFQEALKINPGDKDAVEALNSTRVLN